MFKFSNQLYGSSIPKSQEDIEKIKNEGIEVIISFTQPLTEINDPQLEHILLPIPDFDIPTEGQIDYFLQLVKSYLDDGKKILVHCYAGCGRTGLMLAIISIVFFDNDYETAMKNLLSIRPCSIEVLRTLSQHLLLRKISEKYHLSS